MLGGMRRLLALVILLGFAAPFLAKGWSEVQQVWENYRPVDLESIPAGDRELLDALVVAADSDVAYNRDDWVHWIDLDDDCQDTRQEVLAAESAPDALVWDQAGCQVTAGRWRDPYTGRVFTDPADLDIDHLVPLGAAARSGGQAWSAQRKEDYANWLTDDRNLIAVDASANRAKSDQTPNQWRPDNRRYWCTYARDWAAVKVAWGLTVTRAEHSALTRMLATCGDR